MYSHRLILNFIWVEIIKNNCSETDFVQTFVGSKSMETMERRVPTYGLDILMIPLKSLLCLKCLTLRKPQLVLLLNKLTDAVSSQNAWKQPAIHPLTQTPVNCNILSVCIFVVVWKTGTANTVLFFCYFCRYHDGRLHV